MALSAAEIHVPERKDFGKDDDTSMDASDIRKVTSAMEKQLWLKSGFGTRIVTGPTRAVMLRKSDESALIFPFANHAGNGCK
mmetsp:Transcript_14514/g.30554  ORF Transcript_14514/g.30554 Transcript_14514/m.30554 type:complete len:82 (-) Transcript_14514:308-553(-)